VAEDDAQVLEQARARELREFELISMGIEGKGNNNNNTNSKKRKVPTMEEGNGNNSKEADNIAASEEFRQREVDVDGKRRKIFELGEAEIARYAQSEQERLKKEIEREKVRRNKPTCILLYVLTGVWKKRQSPSPLYPPFGSPR
jgi:nitric oxide synthase-interacting protein